MVRYSFLVRLSHPLLHAGLSRHIFDHLIRPEQNRLWNRHADLFSCLEVDHQLKPRDLFNGQLCRPSTFEDFVDKNSCTTCHLDKVRSVSHHPAIYNPSSFGKYRWQFILHGQFYDICSVDVKDGADSKRRPSTRLLVIAANALSISLGFRTLNDSIVTFSDGAKRFSCP